MLLKQKRNEIFADAWCPLQKDKCAGRYCAWFQTLEREPMQPDDEVRGRCAMSYLEDIAYQLKNRR